MCVGCASCMLDWEAQAIHDPQRPWLRAEQPRGRNLHSNGPSRLPSKRSERCNEEHVTPAQES